MHSLDSQYHQAMFLIELVHRVGGNIVCHSIAGRQVYGPSFQPSRELHHAFQVQQEWLADILAPVAR
jgi:hypothetical protein